MMDSPGSGIGAFFQQIECSRNDFDIISRCTKSPHVMRDETNAMIRDGSSTDASDTVFPFSQNLLYKGWKLYKTRMYWDCYNPNPITDDFIGLPIKNRDILFGCLLIDAIFEAIDNHLEVSSDIKNDSIKKHLNHLANLLYKNDSFLDETKLPNINIQTSSDRIEHLINDVAKYIRTNRYSSKKIQNFIEYMIGILSIPVIRCQNGLRYNCLENDEETISYRRDNSMIFKDFYFCYACNKRFHFLECLHVTDRYKISTHLFTALFFCTLESTIEMDSTMYQCIKGLIDDYKQKFSFFFHNKPHIDWNTSIWTELSEAFPLSITCICFTFANSFQSMIANLKAILEGKTEEKKSSEELEFLEMIEEDAQNVITEDDLEKNPFEEIADDTKSVLADGSINWDGFGCPFRIFTLKVSQIEELLNNMFPNPLISDPISYQPKDYFYKFYLLNQINPKESGYLPSKEDLVAIKKLAIQQSQKRYPQFSGLLGLLPCEWKYEEYKTSFFERLSCPYKLIISPLAKSENKLIKVRALSLNQWKRLLQAYCIGTMEYQKKDIRFGFQPSCMNRKMIQSCKKNILTIEILDR